jgi:hypothetical protein
VAWGRSLNLSVLSFTLPSAEGEANVVMRFQ